MGVMVHFHPFPSISSLVQIAKDFKSNSEGAVISEIMTSGFLATQWSWKFVQCTFGIACLVFLGAPDPGNCSRLFRWRIQLPVVLLVLQAFVRSSARPNPRKCFKIFKRVSANLHLSFARDYIDFYIVNSGEVDLNWSLLPNTCYFDYETGGERWSH